MVSVPIGGVRVDLQLNSAAFIRDIAKSTGAMNAGVQKVNTTLTGLQSTVGTINKTFLAFLTVREINKVIRFTDECLKLAATIKGPLGTATKDFLDKATALENSFKIGVAQGFMDAVNEGLKTGGASLQELASAGIILGNVLGRVFTSIVNFLTHDIPEGVKTSIAAFNVIIAKFNEWSIARDKAAQQPSALAPGAPGSALLGPGRAGGLLPMIDPSAIESSKKSWVDFSKTQAVVAGSLQTTAEAQRQLNAAAQNFHDLAALSNAAWDDAATPMQKYEEALGRIIFLEREHAISAETSARLTTQANSELFSTYLAGVQQATGALAGAFRENKAIQIANAVVNTAAGVVKAFGDPKLVYPLDFAVAASIAAAGAAQIATIIAAQPGSAGGHHSKALKTPSGGGAIASAGAASTAAAPAAKTPGQAVNITLVGSGGFDRQQVRALIAEINSAVGDGAELRVSG